jgi:hypothetical protein
MSFKRKPPEGNVRRVSSNGRNIRGVSTNKAGRIVQFESWAERAFLLRIDRDPDVADYCSQPERFPYTDREGKPHTYTPDFKVWRRNGEIEIHEVTMSVRHTRPEIRQREEAARAICQARGWRYVVHTEKSLPQLTELANLLALFRYRPDAYAHQEITRIALDRLTLHSEGQPVPLHALVACIADDLNIPRPIVLAGLCHLLWYGKLSTDLNTLLFVSGELASNAMVWIESGKEN